MIEGTKLMLLDWTSALQIAMNTLLNKLAYIFGIPSKGDVIVFNHPKEKNRFLIKRITLVNNSDEYFVIGDNKNFSQDSRHFGPIKKNLIIGKVWIHSKK